MTWGLVLDLFVSKMEATTEEQITSKKPPLDHENKFKPSLHSKRETINKIIGVCSGPTYVYIVVSNLDIIQDFLSKLGIHMYIN